MEGCLELGSKGGFCRVGQRHHPCTKQTPDPDFKGFSVPNIHTWNAQESEHPTPSDFHLWRNSSKFEGWARTNGCGLDPGWSNFPIICQCCNKSGDYTRECPNVFDVQLMTTQERLELIPELLVLAGISGIPPSEDNFEPEAEEEVQKEEGFGNHSQWIVCPCCLYITNFSAWMLRIKTSFLPHHQCSNQINSYPNPPNHISSSDSTPGRDAFQSGIHFKLQIPGHQSGDLVHKHQRY